MIEVHHLNNSRSQRILWLLEELNVPYKIVPYQRDSQTMLAPENLKKVHPLGKSPVICDGEMVLPESGAIVEYLADKYGPGKLAPKVDAPERPRYLYWMHYAEGSIMTPILLAFYAVRFGEAMAPMKDRVQSQLKLHFDVIEEELEKAPYFLGDELSAADMMMSFPLEMSGSLGILDDYSNIKEFLERIRALPSYRSALEKGGAYDMGGVMKLMPKS